MTITQYDLDNYIATLRNVNQTAADKIIAYINKYGLSDTKQLLDYSYSIVATYAEAAGAWAAEMYDAIALLEGKYLPPAEIADIATYGDVAKAINGTLKVSENAEEIASAATRWVKMASADTMLNNAIRDGAQFAWVPHGDTCPFCITLASRGWQNASKKALKDGHAEHIHSNCDCQYTIRFDENTNVEGYDPDKYLSMYRNAEGSTPQERINSMRRASNVTVQTGGRITGGHHYRNIEKEDRLGMIAAKQYEKYSRVDDSEIIANNTGFSVEDIQTIRSHVFFEKHDLDDGYQRFAPDYDMAVAWSRLQNGNFLPRDITLLNHELLESQLEKKYNLSARQAHDRTQETYNWVDQLMRETNGKGEEDGLL